MARDPGITPEQREEFGITDEILHELLAGGNFVMDGNIIRHIDALESGERIPLDYLTSEEHWEWMEENDLMDVGCDEVLLAVGIFVETPEGTLCTRMV